MCKPTIDDIRGLTYEELVFERERINRFPLEDMCAYEMEDALRRMPRMLERACRLAEEKAGFMDVYDIRMFMRQLRYDIEDIKAALPDCIVFEVEAWAEAEAEAIAAGEEPTEASSLAAMRHARYKRLAALRQP